MNFRILFLLSIIFALASCNKPDPNPELRDPIYNDLNSRLGSVTQALEAEKKTLETNETALKEVVPQTGQIKYAQKRVYESQAKIQKLSQEVAYLKLKIESRLKEARKSYFIAFKKDETWPNPAEFELYEKANAMRSIKLNWDANARAKALSAGKKAAPGGHGEGGEKKAEATKEEHH